MELALLSAVDEAPVRKVVGRVAERRIAYITEQLITLGAASATARVRATIAYATFLGNLQLGRAAPSMLSRNKAARDRYLDQAMRAI